MFPFCPRYWTFVFLPSSRVHQELFPACATFLLIPQKGLHELPCHNKLSTVLPPLPSTSDLWSLLYQSCICCRPPNVGWCHFNWFHFLKTVSSSTTWCCCAQFWTSHKKDRKDRVPFKVKLFSFFFMDVVSTCPLAWHTQVSGRTRAFFHGSIMMALPDQIQESFQALQRTEQYVSVAYSLAYFIQRLLHSYL